MKIGYFEAFLYRNDNFVYVSETIRWLIFARKFMLVSGGLTFRILRYLQITAGVLGCEAGSDVSPALKGSTTSWHLQVKLYRLTPKCSFIEL